MKHIARVLMAACAAFFIAGSASAQNSGTVTNHAFAIGKGAGQVGYTSLLCGSAQLAVGQSAADPICRTITGDVTISAAGATAIGATKVTSAMLNADVFSTAHTWAGQQTFVAPILGTPASGTLTNATGLPVSTGISGLATGIASWLATPSSANLRAALTDETGTGAAYFQGGDLGTPSAGVLTNATGLPIATGISGFGTGCATFLGTPSSANLRACLTDESGTGVAYFQGGALGTPSSGTLTSATGLPISTGVSGLGTGVATALGTNIGSAGAPVLFNGALGTPTSGTLTNATGLPISGIAGLGTGIGTALATNAGSAGAPVLLNGALGTPSSGTLTNATGLPIGTGVSGLGAGVASLLAGTATGTGGPVGSSSPTITNPTVGTQLLSDYTDKAASTKFVTDKIAGATAGVSSLGSQSGALTVDGGSFSSTLIPILRYDAPQSLTDAQKGIALSNIGAAQSNLINGKIVESHASNAVTFAVKTLAGSDPSASDPVIVRFPDASLGTLNSATSITVSSGSTLGTTSGVPFRLWIVLINDSGTYRLGVRNCSNSGSVYGLPANGVITSTAEGGAGAADGVAVTYTGTAVSAKPFIPVASADYESGVTTAGTWAASPTRIVSIGASSKLPGDVVQDVFVTGSGSATSSSGTPASVGAGGSASIYPTSAINIIRLEQSGNGGTTAAGVAGKVQFANGSTLIGVPATIYSAGTGLTSPFVLAAQDKPATTSLVTYNTYISIYAGSGSFIWDPSSLGVAIRIKEIVG